MWLDGPNIGIFTFLVSDLVTKSPSIPYFKSAPWLSRYALSELLKIMAMSTYDSLKLKNRPVRMINIPNRSVESVASLMTIYLVEVLLVAELAINDKKRIIPIAILLFGLHTVLGFFGNQSGTLFGGMYQTSGLIILMKNPVDFPFFSSETDQKGKNN